MTDFAAINAASGVKPEPTGPKVKTDTDDAIGQEMFLKLLVTQMQNQDPMNPDDPTEFTSQLAVYSQLEQLTNLNSGMEKLVESKNSSDKLASLNTIGKEVSFPADKVLMEGSPVQIGYSLADNSAAEVSIALVKDGRTVARLEGSELGKGDHYLTWDGKLGNGSPVPAGEYEIRVSVIDGDGKTTSAPSLIRAKVTGVDLSGSNGGTLVTSSGETSFNSITGVFDRKESDSTATGESAPEENESAAP